MLLGLIDIVFLLRQPGGIFNQVDRAVRIPRRTGSKICGNHLRRSGPGSGLFQQSHQHFRLQCGSPIFRAASPYSYLRARYFYNSSFSSFASQAAYSIRLIVPSGFRGAPEARSSAIISGKNYPSISPLFSDCDWISGASHGCICTSEAKKSQLKQPEGGKYVRHEQHHSRNHRHCESRTQ